MKDIKSFTFDGLTEELTGLGEKSFRAKQIYTWLHQRLISDFDEMTDISLKLREKLKNNYSLNVLKPVKILKSEIDGTVKFLFGLPDGNVIEGVLMRYKHGNSACISTQVGCRMGCGFCASTVGGLVRNLEEYEMLEEIYCIERSVGEKISNIVLMGSGEPLDNYDNVVKFIRMISSPSGLNISPRNITLSTCGIVPRIYDLANEGIPVTLALSLHAPDDAVRRTLMPVASSYFMQDLIKACKYYFDTTKRRITFEYSLVSGVNDKREHAVKLCEVIRGMNCHVNLIPVNPIEERSYSRSRREEVENFRKHLEKNGINVTVRRELGRDISGSCGQLRRRHIDTQGTYT